MPNAALPMAATPATPRSDRLCVTIQVAAFCDRPASQARRWSNTNSPGATTRKICLLFSSYSSSLSSSAFGFDVENEYDDENDCQREVSVLRPRSLLISLFSVL